MINAPPDVPGVQLKLAVVFETPAWFLTSLVGVLGTTGMNIEDPLPATEASDDPMLFYAVILA
jgi:hypothetical protein